jgi:Helix-turn-helix domain
VIERFVDALQGAEFLGIRPRRLLELARAGHLPGHPIGQGRRKTWRFRLSELAEAMAKEKPMLPLRRGSIIDTAVPGNRIGGSK